MALDFPAGPHPDGFQWEAPNNVTYTWRGNHWTGHNDEVGVVLEEPVIRGVAIQDQNVSGGRFTSERFLVNADADLGRPEATLALKAEITEDPNLLRANTRPSTTEITDVQTVQFADGFEVEYVNDNSWNQIIWAGPPWNCYIAFGSGTSAEGIATSPDGRTWTRHTFDVNYGNYPNPSGVAYSEGDGLLYYLSATGSNGTYYSTAVQTADDNFVWDQVPYSLSLPGTGAGGGGWWQSWGDLYRDELNGSWFGSRASSSNGYTCSLMRGPTNATLEGSWTDLISVVGSIVGRMMIHQDQSITWSANGKNQQGSYANGGTWWFPTPHTSSTNIKISHSGRNKIGRAMKVGTVGWAFPGTTDNGGDNLGRRLYWFSGDNPTDNCMQWHDLNNWADFPDITEADLRDSLWIEDLGIGVVCGTCSTDTRANHGVLFTTTDAVTWTRMWTNAPGDDAEYKWERMVWNADRAELLLVASAGTNPGGRVGYTQTVGTTIQAPQLTFATTEGLDAFGPGQPVDQSDMNAGGIIADLDQAAGTMTIKSSTGTWGPANTGLRVLGPVETYDPAYAVFDADGNVTRLSQFDPGFQQMNGPLPLQLQFPANFEGGNQPDADIPAGSRIRAELQLTSSSNGFTSQTQEWSPTITPT